MRVDFSKTETLKKATDLWTEDNEFLVRRLWEKHYQLPSVGNPLFEDVPISHHIIHISALGTAERSHEEGESVTADPDEEYKRIQGALDKGVDPFTEVRDKLSVLSDDLSSLNFRQD